jgi:hypothetical protein
MVKGLSRRKKSRARHSTNSVDDLVDSTEAGGGPAALSKAAICASKRGVCKMCCLDRVIQRHQSFAQAKAMSK